MDSLERLKACESIILESVSLAFLKQNQIRPLSLRDIDGLPGCIHALSGKASFRQSPPQFFLCGANRHFLRRWQFIFGIENVLQECKSHSSRFAPSLQKPTRTTREGRTVLDRLIPLPKNPVRTL